MFSLHFIAERNHSDLESLGEESVPLVASSGFQDILERGLDRIKDAAFCLFLIWTCSLDIVTCQFFRGTRHLVGSFRYKETGNNHDHCPLLLRCENQKGKLRHVISCL